MPIVWLSGAVTGRCDGGTHRYYDVVWETLTSDLPTLERAVRELIHEDGA